MTDPLRFDRPASVDADGRERDARIEELLLVGLDHYFAGRHELAINIWTRVLFLDRSHNPVEFRIASERLGQRSGPKGGASRTRRTNGCGRSASGLGPVLISASDLTRSGRCSASAVAT